MKKTTNLTRSVLTRFLRASRGTALLTMAAAMLALSAVAQVPVFTNVWSVPAGTYADLIATNQGYVRGIAISPLTTNVLYPSTFAGTNGSTPNHVSVLDFANGSNYLAQLNGTGVGGGAVTLMNARVSDDGSVYVCNRRDNNAATFTIYRWPSESDTATAPVKVVDEIFTWRMGDHMDVRGSGINTEIVVVGSAASGTAVSTNFVIFRPTDATLTAFTNFSITIPGNTAASIVSAHGVTFEGTNNAIYVSSGTAIRRVSYDPATLTATVTRTNATDAATCRGLEYYKATNGVEILACVQYNTAAASAQIARAFQIPASPTAALVSVLSANFPGPYTFSQNGNGLGQVDAKHGYFAFGAPGYGLTFFKVDYVFNSPPTVGAASGGGTFVEGWAGPISLSVVAGGTAPLAYQWYKNDGLSTNAVGGATTNSYSLGTADLGDQGLYFCIVTNAFGSVTSGVAGVTVLPGAYSNVASNLWTVAPGSRPYLATDDRHRGMAYDPVSNVVVVVSRTTSNGVYLLNADTGADIGPLDTSFLNAPNTPPGLSGIAVNMVGVAEDGAVYVCNLTDTNSISFTIYRWQNADPTLSPTLAYQSFDGFQRVGDTMSVRGSGLGTQILCADRRGTNLFLFTTADGSTFTPTLIAVTNLPLDAIANGFAGLGLAFGEGDTFWAKSAGFRLRKVAFNAVAGTAEVVETYDTPTDTESALGVDAVNGYVATVAYGQNPRNLSIWDISQGPPNAVQLDREVFGSNNANLGGTGAVAFDVAGGRLFALNSNNGLIALTYASKPFIAPVPQGGIVTWSGPGALQSAPVVTGPYNDILGATSPYTNTAASEIYFRVRR